MLLRLASTASSDKRTATVGWFRAPRPKSHCCPESCPHDEIHSCLLHVPGSHRRIRVFGTGSTATRDITRSTGTDLYRLGRRLARVDQHRLGAQDHCVATAVRVLHSRVSHL